MFRQHEGDGGTQCPYSEARSSSGSVGDYLTIIPRARKGPESIAIDSEAMRARGIIGLVQSN